MKKQALYPLLIFLLLAIVQWVFTGNMIASHYAIVAHGTAFRFQTQPIDPSHPFTGKYIYLDYKENRFVEKDDDSLFSASDSQKEVQAGDDVYLLLTTDSKGFAAIQHIAKNPPPTGNYVQAKCSYTNVDTGNRTLIFIQYPFDKFYMEEYKAPEAEKIYISANRDTASVCYALVKVYKGKAVVENVFINNTAISELIHK